MDRRDALKKLGGGAVVVVGASTIASSPAFAYDEPTPGTAANLVSVSEAGNQVTFNISDGTATCPGSANSTTATVVARSTDLTTLVSGDGLDFGIIPFSTVLRLPASELPQTITAISFILAKVGAISSQPVNFANNDSFRADITITFQCTYSDGTTRDRAVTTERTATRIGGAWSVG